MRLITQCSRLITESIDDFWAGVTEISKKEKTLDADELLMIFIYICFKSNLSEMYAHLKLCNQFSTATLRNSKLGYYGSTMEVSLEQVLNYTED